MQKVSKAMTWALCDILGLKFGMEAVDLEAPVPDAFPVSRAPERAKVPLMIQPALRTASL